jgi:hypothetical protein
MRFVRVVAILVGLVGTSRVTRGQTPPEAPPAAPESEPPKPPAPEPKSPEPKSNIDLRLQDLERQNQELRDEVEVLKDDQRFVEERVAALAPVAAKLSGYLDVGFFSVAGDGAGIRSDIGYHYFPEYDVPGGVPASWVFMGDPLSTMVNSRGDPATTGESRAITFDGIKAHKSTFLVNTLNVALFSEVGKNAIVTAKFDVLPRGRDVSQPGVALGDYIDMRLGYLEYRMAHKRMKLSLFVGKFDSVLGFEYRSQEAPTRIEVTPSLICRYTCGYPIGVKARASLFDEAIVLNVAVTNGSHSSEGFPFHDEIDSNQFKTIAGRLSYRLPFGHDFEVGVSGMVGAQDGQPDDNLYEWMYGVDVHFHRNDFVFRAEFVQGHAPGKTDLGSPTHCDLAPCLSFKGAYGLVGYRLTNIIMPYVRVDWRDALHESGASFVYISKLWRETSGIRFALNERMTLKAEYTVNRELGRLPQIANDVFTSSLVVTY